VKANSPARLAPHAPKVKHLLHASPTPKATSPKASAAASAVAATEAAKARAQPMARLLKQQRRPHLVPTSLNQPTKRPANLC
jgi:hypothetical protein